MVKKSVVREESFSSSSSSSERINGFHSDKYKGVRKRKWGKFVSEIRLPNSRERIWLGSYDTAEKAARAFDAALFCLRGKSAKFNFPDNPPEIVNGRSMTPAEIQVAAARYANSDATRDTSGSGRVDNLDSSYSSVSSFSEPELRVDSPCPSVSDGGAVQVENEISEIPMDTAFLDNFSIMGTGENSNVADFGIFPGFDDFFGAPLPCSNIDFYDGEENYNEGFSSSQDSFLWNF
ncbi:hypothetical protein M9H77_14556 [Catharanthus roseus]|uniref:Uncharacterized protein n=1 Tax=Catharanthus roseus TaxID=4058 RepID=A0ACC0BNL6_CATRO|nr:hypothetical protein M9H77_14556 [Catharanthus roseus]